MPKNRRRGNAITMTAVIVAAMLVALFPVAMWIRSVKSERAAVGRNLCMARLRLLGIALHNYESGNGRYPPSASYDPHGKPLLSWRVAILPFIDEKALYDQFHQDEAWDSPHNAA